MLSRNAVIEDLANSLAQRRREVLRGRVRQAAYGGLARAVVFGQRLPASPQSRLKLAVACEPMPALDAA